VCADIKVNVLYLISQVESHRCKHIIQ